MRNHSRSWYNDLFPTRLAAVLEKNLVFFILLLTHGGRHTHHVPCRVGYNLNPVLRDLTVYRKRQVQRISVLSLA